MSLCCPICEGDEKFCKEHGCGSDQNTLDKSQLLVSKKVFEDLLGATDEKGNFKEAKPKKVLCPRCKKPVHIDEFFHYDTGSVKYSCFGDPTQLTKD